MPRVLITDDSPVIALLLRAMFEKEPDFTVVGVARHGGEAVAMTAALRPDVVTMDIRMPEMDGFEATRQIMEQTPTPIVVISSGVDDEEMRTTFRAIEEGALAVLEKPPGPADPRFQRIRQELVETVRAMAEVKVIRRRSQTKRITAPVAPNPPSLSLNHHPTKVVAIGSSTGGPAALQTILQQLPQNLPFPIVITQHMSKGFVSGLLQWLQTTCALPLSLATHQTYLQPAHIYIAPDDYHLCITMQGGRVISLLDDSAAVKGFRPSANPLFQSIAQSCAHQAVGVLLTGMGDDGAAGLLAMHKAGALTVAQDEASCVVFGMPACAIALGAVDKILPIEKIAEALLGARQ